MNATSPKRELSRTQLLMISFAAIFGSGWLFSPLYAAQIAGPYALAAWGIGAIISMIIGVTMAEVVVLYPKAGGLSPVVRETHGDFLSLLLTIFNLVVFIILPAIEVRAVLQYLSTYLKSAALPEGLSVTFETALAFMLLALVTLVNLYGARITAAITRVVVFFKLFTPILVCVAFASALGSEKMTDMTRLSFSPTHSGSVPWTEIFQAIATSGIIFSFNGFNQATLFAGEAKNPKRAIPFAILGSLIVSGLLYLAIQYVLIMAIPQTSLVNGWKNISFPGDDGPFAGLSIALGLGGLLTVIYIDAVISPLGTAFSYASAAPRLLYSLGEIKLNRHGVSPTAFLGAFFLECLAFILLPNLKAMIALLVAAFVLCYTVAPASLLVLRKTQPKLHRPFRVKWAPLACYLSISFSNLMVFSCGWIALRNLALFSGGVLTLYLAFLVKKKQKQEIQSTLQGSGWFLFQIFSLGILSFYHQKSALDFGWISFSIAALSWFALLLATRVTPQDGLISAR